MKKPMAYCTSYKCTGITHSINTPRLALKPVPLTAITCPDCNSVLVWKTKPRPYIDRLKRKLTDKERDWLI